MQIVSVRKNEDDRKIDKEIIRRLRIQNKKLIEQIIKAKEENKKAKLKKEILLKHVNELLKIINK